MPVLKTITFAEILNQLARAQDDQTIQLAYNNPSLLTATGIKRVLVHSQETFSGSDR